MTKILLDECLPVKLKYRLQETNPVFQVSTVTERKWTGLKNGKLLERAQQEFEVFVTIDQNLLYQQELSKYAIAIVALKAKSNRYQDLMEFLAGASRTIENAAEGKFYEVLSPND